jgi:FkbM family methyltransferase
LTLALLCEQAANGDIIHAGTYFGDFVPAIAHACGPQNVVWAFEPNHENFCCAQLTTQLNNLENVRLMHAALAARRGELMLETFDVKLGPHGGVSRILQPGDVAEINRAERVSAVMLDEVIPRDRRVAAIQLDVEGYEQNALSGGLETIERNLPVLVLETLPTAIWLDRHLTPLGYQETSTVHDNVVLRAR